MKCLNYVVHVDLNPCKNVKQMIPNAIGAKPLLVDVFWNHVKANDSKWSHMLFRYVPLFWNHVKANDSKWSKADYMVCQNKNLSNRSI